MEHVVTTTVGRAAGNDKSWATARRQFAITTKQTMKSETAQNSKARFHHRTQHHAARHWIRETLEVKLLTNQSESITRSSDGWLAIRDVIQVGTY